MKFDELFINDRIKKSLVELSYITLTDVQENVMPYVFDEEDVLCLAKTGSGKTASFLIPMLNNILKEKDRFIIRGLIIAPTRELAIQIHENIQSYGKYTNIRSLAIIGGVKDSYQKHKLNQGVDIVVATPGRLIDLLKQKSINLKKISTFVVDELDKLLDMGFINDIKIINEYLSNKQTLMFSATINDKIKEISYSVLKNPKEIILEQQKNDIIEYIYYIEKINKIYLIKDIMKQRKYKNVIAFVNTKLQAQKLSNFLNGNTILADCIHKDKTQIERKKALNKLKNNEINVLVATDILSRGIDVDNLDVVINFDIPNDEATYTHRIGRTGRNNNKGIVINFCSENEKYLFEKLNNIIEEDHKYK